MKASKKTVQELIDETIERVWTEGPAVDDAERGSKEGPADDDEDQSSKKCAMHINVVVKDEATQQIDAVGIKLTEARIDEWASEYAKRGFISDSMRVKEAARYISARIYRAVEALRAAYPSERDVFGYFMGDFTFALIQLELSAIEAVTTATDQAHRSYGERLPSPAPGGEEVQPISLDSREMEFQDWNSFLVKVTCAAYQMSPAEVGGERPIPSPADLANVVMDPAPVTMRGAPIAPAIPQDLASLEGMAPPSRQGRGPGLFSNRSPNGSGDGYAFIVKVKAREKDSITTLIVTPKETPWPNGAASMAPLDPSIPGMHAQGVAHQTVGELIHKTGEALFQTMRRAARFREDLYGAPPPESAMVPALQDRWHISDDSEARAWLEGGDL